MTSRSFPGFERSFFGAGERYTRIGAGEVGGKASGLLLIRDRVLSALDPAAFPDFRVSVPAFTVVATEFFDRFLEENDLWERALSGDPDDEIALAFQQAHLPARLVGDLRALTEEVHRPLAIRSSSLLEDARERPFAGVYATKMTPNNQPDVDTRFRRLVEAIKYVWASTFFAGAVEYRKAAGAGPDEERMAVVIQEVVGRRHGDRHYPDVSGVARSYGFYRSGEARPEEGVVLLALGLGKTVVDGEAGWSFSPARPKARPPYGSVGELLKSTQTAFWAVNMGKPPAFDPVRETEYLLKSPLEEAEGDGTLRFTASTYDPRSDRIVPGTGVAGPRVLDFAPLLVLQELPFVPILRALLRACEEAVGGPVEMEFAATLDPKGDPPGRLGLLQVRPMLVSRERVDLSAPRPGLVLLVASESAMGNGVVEGVQDVVYLKRGFEMRRSGSAAREVTERNQALREEGRPYVLIGFGRWGSADPWLGVPVRWGDVAGAAVLVEAPHGERSIEMSQGSHFFHNISSFGVGYFSVTEGGGTIDWGFLDSLPSVAESESVRHVRFPEPLRIEVDGRSGRGIIFRREVSR